MPPRAPGAPGDSEQERPTRHHLDEGEQPRIEPQGEQGHAAHDEKERPARERCAENEYSGQAWGHWAFGVSALACSGCVDRVTTIAIGDMIAGKVLERLARRRHGGRGVRHLASCQ